MPENRSPIFCKSPTHALAIAIGVPGENLAHHDMQVESQVWLLSHNLKLLDVGGVAGFLIG